MPSLRDEGAAVEAEMSLLPAVRDELAARRRHHRLRRHGALLPAQGSLAAAHDRAAERQNIWMLEKDETANDYPDNAGDEQRRGLDSRFRLVVVAALRSRQLLRGAPPRVEADTKRRRNTSIAVEEVRRGLVHFTITDEDQRGGGGRRGHDERNGVGEDQTDLRRRVA